MKLRYIDRFADWCLNNVSILLESSKRDRYIGNIESRVPTLNNHLFKLYVFQVSQCRNHWKEEVYDRLSEMLRYKWRGFDSGDYHQWLFDEHFHNRDGVLRRVQLVHSFEKVLREESDEHPSPWTVEEFVGLCDTFYRRIIGWFDTEDIDVDRLYEILDEVFLRED